MERPSHSELRAELDALAEPAARTLAERRVASARSVALPRAVKLVVVVPLLYLVMAVVLRSAGFDFHIPWWLVATLSLTVPAVHLGLAGERAGGVEVTGTAALSVIDDELALQDRLAAAREYLDVAEPTPFMAAAIEDARAHVLRARGFVPSHISARARLAWRDAGFPLAGALALIVQSWIPVAHATAVPPGRSGDPLPAVADVPEASRDADETGATATEEARKRESEQSAADDPTQRSDGSVDSDQTKRSRGDVGRGKSSAAQSTSGRSTGEGEATDQAQPTKGGRKRPKKPRTAKPPEEGKRKRRDRTPETDEDSVASSGQGKGRGSSKSPTASDWSSKDQSVADDEDELEDEDDVDDEDEESEARGGVQPNLRQRKPPVNRDLVLGFGGGPPPPHANGRGGPGLPKKQRGVAQLVLGIPYPDQITGKPNPGRTKVTQERIEPQAERAGPAAAQARTPRSSRFGHLARTVLLPWMQDLVRDFQQTLSGRDSNVRSDGR